MDRIILHSDINNFYASVETLLHPEYKGKCMAVAGDPEKRHGIVLAKNEQAKAYGVKTGEALWQAKKKCPDIIFVPPTYKKYAEYSRAVFDIYIRYTDLVESFGQDECWLDTTSSVLLFGDGLKVANRLREDIRKETGLTVSIGVSFNKIFAKLGSDIKKPDAVTLISKDNFKSIVWPLPAQSMIYIGRHTAQSLAGYNINTIGDIAACDKKDLERLFGKTGARFYEYAWGLDNEPVKRYDDVHVPDSVGNGATTPQDITTPKDAARLIYALSETIASRLRRLKVSAGGVAVSLRDNKLKTITRQESLLSPIRTSSEIAEKAIEILARHYDFDLKPPLRTITVTVFALVSADEACQLSIFQHDSTLDNVLESNIDRLREKYGHGVIQRGLNMDTPYSCADREDDDFLPFSKAPPGKKD